jgi:peptidyl-prolyl cis-trans isomerase C
MKIRQIAAIAGAMILLGACSPEEPTADTGPGPLGPGDVASVDGERIPESIFRLYALNATQRNPDQVTPEERQRIVDDLVFLLVLANEAERRGIPKQRAVAAEIELLRWQSLARALTTRFNEENPPTETELRARYDETLPTLARKEYRARHILLESQEDAESVIDRLDSGADFAALALEHSTGPTGPDGGDLGWFSADSMVEPFADAVAEMEVGTYTKSPVETQFGWHVILLEESRDQQAPGLEAVRDELSVAVQRQKLQGYVNSLRDAAEVDINSVRSQD